MRSGSVREIRPSSASWTTAVATIGFVIDAIEEPVVEPTVVAGDAERLVADQAL